MLEIPLKTTMISLLAYKDGIYLRIYKYFISLKYEKGTIQHDHVTMVAYIL